jgi:hypothetical protein
MEGLTVPMWWENQSPSVHVGKFQTKLMIQILFQTQFSQMSNSGFALGKTTKLQYHIHYQIHYQNDSSGMEQILYLQLLGSKHTVICFCGCMGKVGL